MPTPKKLIPELAALTIVNGEFLLVMHDGVSGKQITVANFLDYIKDQLAKTGGGGSNPGEEAPAEPEAGVSTWIDLSDPTNPCMKIYINEEIGWVTLTDPNVGDMKAEIYDPTGKAVNVYDYVGTEIATKVHGIPESTITSLRNHMNATGSHVTSEETGKWDALATHAASGTGHMNTDTANKITAITTHIGQDAIHVSAAERESWNNAYDHVSDDDKHVSSTERTQWNAASTHVSNSDIHVTAALKTKWNGMVDVSDMNEAINNMKSYSAGSGQGAGGHNSVYRGQKLGTAVTTAQWAAIASGEFTDMYIGDYWEIGGVIWRIAAFDYYLGTGDTACTKHHVTIVPDNKLGDAAMNSSSNTSTGYANSAMFKSNLNTYKTTIQNAFGAAHILTHRKYLSNAASGGLVTGASWYDCTVDIMSEVNVYGSRILGSEPDDAATVQPLYSTDKTQYPLFAFRPDLIMDNKRAWYWLREVVNGSYFADVNSHGACGCHNASGGIGVRPAFSLIGD